MLFHFLFPFSFLDYCVRPRCLKLCMWQILRLCAISFRHIISSFFFFPPVKTIGISITKKKKLKFFFYNSISCCWGVSVTLKGVVPVTSLEISAAAGCWAKGVLLCKGNAWPVLVMFFLWVLVETHSTAFLQSVKFLLWVSLVGLPWLLLAVVPSALSPIPLPKQCWSRETLQQPLSNITLPCLVRN